MTRDPANFREYAGTLISVIIISAYLAIGFVQMAVFITTSAIVPVIEDWNTTMQSLANIALGYLIGKQTSSPATATVSVPIGDTVSTTTSVETLDREKK